MSRTTHDATVHSGERFGVEEAANCRVIVERHLAHFQLRIHPDLKNIDLDQLSFEIDISISRENDGDRGKRIMENNYLQVWKKKYKGSFLMDLPLVSFLAVDQKQRLLEKKKKKGSNTLP